MGQVNSHDADLHDKTPTYSIDGVTKLATATTVGSETYDYSKTTDYGTLYLNSSSGKYVFKIDDTKGGVVDKMASGDAKILDFGITVNDGHDGTGASTIEVTIHGTNDQPTLKFVTKDSHGDAVVVNSGDLSVVEAGAGVVHTSVSASVLGADVDAHAATSFGLVVGHKDVADIDGRNLAFDKDSANQSGLGAGHTTVDGTYGTLSIDASGKYTYSLDESKANFLDSGEERQENFTIYVRDEHGAWDSKQITVAVHGTNDAPTFDNNYNHSVKENGYYVKGDRGKNLVSAENTEKTTDSNAGAANGSTGKPYHEFVVSGALHATDVDGVDGSVTSPKDTLTFGLQARDGSNKVVNLYAAGHEITVDVLAPTSGTLSSTNYRIVTEGVSIKNYEKCGTLVLHEDGSYTFTLTESEAVNRLSEGKSVNITFTPLVTDSNNIVNGHPQNTISGGTYAETTGIITVTVNGSNEVPTITSNAWKSSVGLATVGGSEYGIVVEDSSIATTITGNIAGKDTDTSDNLRYHLVASVKDGAALNTVMYVKADGTLVDEATFKKGSVDDFWGKVSIESSGGNAGKYTFELYQSSAAVQKLSGNDIKNLDIPVVVVDNHGAYKSGTINVQIQGSYDAIRVTSNDAHSIQAWESGVARVGSDPNASFEKSTEYDGSQATGGTFKVIQVDANTDNLQYGFKVTFDGGIVKYIKDSYDTGYGKLTIDRYGKFSFELDQDTSAVKALNAGDLTKITNIELAAWDTRQGTTSGNTFTPPKDLPPATQKLELYIKGTNDKPDFTFNTENSDSRTITFKSGLTEDNSKFSTSTGQLSGTDVDAADTPATLRYSLVYGSGTTQVLEGKYGVLELKPDGSYTYTLTRPDLLQHLDDNTHLKDEVFTVRIQDQRGAYSNATLQIDITGNKDTPIVNISGNSIREDAGHTIYPGSVDHSDDPTTTGQLTLGKIVDDSDEANFGKDGAKAGWTVDSSTSTDIQVVKAYADGISGATVAKGNYGYLVVSPNGSYKYFLTENDNEAIQKLNEGNSLNETFTVVATAGGSTVPQSISIAIHGTNDRPYFTSSTPAFAGAAKVGNFEDQANDWVDTAHPGTVFVGTVTGKADVDDPTNSLVYKFAVSHTDGSTSYATEVKTDYGTISIDPATGKYTYFLDTYSAKLATALNHSNAGIDDSVKVVIIDPHSAVSEPKDITIHITPGSSGTGGSGGSDWRNPSYTFSQLERAVKEDDGFDLHVGSKEHPSPEGVAVTGHLDAIWGVSVISVDAPDYGFGINDGQGNQVQGMEGKYGYLSVNPATGAYTYTLYNTRPDVQALHEGETVKETFSMMFNGKPWTEAFGLYHVNVVINISGTNDSPVVDSYKDIDLAEKDHFTSQATYRIVGSDADAGESATLKYSIDGDHGHSGKVAGNFGTFTLNSDGKYSYKANEGLNLNEGVTETDSFTVLVTDAHGATTKQVIKVNLTGANDAPTVKFDSSVDHTGNTVQASVAEDTHTSLTGNAKTFFEDDKGDSNLTFSAKSVSSNTAGMVVRGEYGVLVVKPDGSYSYVLNNADSKVQGLDSSAKNLSETFTIIATDKHGASNEVTLKVNVSGTDDLPEVTVEKVLTVTEGSPVNSMSGKITVFDADSADVAKSPNLYFEAADKTAHDNISNEYGTFTVKPSGEYTFTLDSSSPAVMALKAGQLVETHATLVVEDQNHNKVTQLITVNIKGSASGPVVENATGSDFDVQAVANPDAGLKYIAQGKVVGTDYEDHEVSYTVKTQGAHGTLGIDKYGSYTYTVDAHDKAVLALGDGNSFSDTVMISVIAKNGQVTDHSIKFTIHGTNDAPVATSETFGTANGQLHATDPDTGDHIASYALQTEAAYGHVTVTADGQYTYDPNIHSEQGLDALQLHLNGSGEWATSFTDSFLFTATDSHGLISAAGKASLAFDVTGKDGGHHVDITTGGETSHLLFGSNSADYLDASSETQNHILYGGGGDDRLYGGSGDDILYGGAGHNQLYGGDGNDTLYAGNDGDHLYGGDGNDHLYGGASNDFLDGGAGNNILNGGAGNNVLVFHTGDTIDGGSTTGLNVFINHSSDTLDSLLADSNQVKNVSVFIQDGAKDGDGTANLTDMNALINAGIKMGTDNSISLDSTQWEKTGEHTFSNVTQDLTITTVNNVTADMTAEKNEFILKNS
ncbi:VCBS domain-containing protein [Desulfovibrio sp. QI0442]